MLAARAPGAGDTVASSCPSLWPGHFLLIELFADFEQVAVSRPVLTVGFYDAGMLSIAGRIAARPSRIQY